MEYPQRYKRKKKKREKLSGEACSSFREIKKFIRKEYVMRKYIKVGRALNSKGHKSKNSNSKWSVHNSKAIESL